ncbi:MAG: hypothetical protein H6674_01300 [Dehalococcoidia bacterium]|nr:hypothetical protein [Dehalococcoidia bacterium]
MLDIHAVCLHLQVIGDSSGLPHRETARPHRQIVDPLLHGRSATVTEALLPFERRRWFFGSSAS